MSVDVIRPRPCGGCRRLLWWPIETCEHWSARALTPAQREVRQQQKRDRESRARRRKANREAVEKFGEIFNV